MQRLLAFFLLGIVLLLFSSCEKEPGPGGKATIMGKLVIEEKNIYCQFTSPAQITYSSADEDVFIVYGDDPSHSERVRTGEDGIFWFPYLRKGKYTIYALGNPCIEEGEVPPPTALQEVEVPVKLFVEIKERDEVVVTPDLVVVRRP